MGQERRQPKKNWKSIREVPISTINDHSLTIEGNANDFTQNFVERISSNESRGSSLARLGIPALVIQRTTSIGSSRDRHSSRTESTKSQDGARPRSILSVVEMSVEDIKPRMYV
jgi:hypothetical protein